MTRASRLKHVFVEFIPEVLEDGTLYVSMQYATVVHRCCCGCGREVVTPLSPTDWRLTFDGEAISLTPSIGNWSYPCRSHYWIEGNRVRWSYSMSDEEIQVGRRADERARQRFYDHAATTRPLDTTMPLEAPAIDRGRWAKLKEWWRSKT